MACSKCGKDGHNKTTCATKKAKKKGAKEKIHTLKKQPYTLSEGPHTNRIINIWTEKAKNKGWYVVLVNKTAGLGGKEVESFSWVSSHKSAAKATAAAKAYWKELRDKIYPYANIGD